MDKLNAGALRAGFDIQVDSFSGPCTCGYGCRYGNCSRSYSTTVSVPPGDTHVSWREIWAALPPSTQKRLGAKAAP